jgi:hypothetical protein
MTEGTKEGTKLLNKRALKTVARLAHVDLWSALRVKRISPLMEREINVDEELINFRESVESYHTAGDTIREYPQMYEHAFREKRLIMQHCFGLVVRMMMGKKLPLPYNREDIDMAVRRLVQIIVDEARYTGKRIDAEMIGIFRPYLSLQQRVALRDFRVDMVMSSGYMQRAQAMIGRLPLLRSK